MVFLKRFMMAMMAVAYDVDMHIYIMYGGLGILTYMLCACEPCGLSLLRVVDKGNERNFLVKM